jgi:hypothetical protein
VSSPRLSREDLQAISKTKWLEVIIHFLSGFRNDTADFSSPHLRPAVESSYVVFVVLYAMIVVSGLVLNALVLARFARTNLYRKNTNRLLANICAANIFQCVFVIPLSLFVLLIQNWIFGPVMCYVLPMMQVRLGSPPGSVQPTRPPPPRRSHRNVSPYLSLPHIAICRQHHNRRGIH